jgi:hypothetical protein
LEGGGLDFIEVMSRSLPGGTEKNHRNQPCLVVRREPGDSEEYITCIFRVKV